MVHMVRRQPAGSEGGLRSSRQESEESAGCLCTYSDVCRTLLSLASGLVPSSAGHLPELLWGGTGCGHTPVAQSFGTDLTSGNQGQ